MVEVVVLGPGGRGDGGFWRFVEVRGGVPILLLLQRNEDLLRGPGEGNHGFPRPPE